jgi:hypothetical protein
VAEYRETLSLTVPQFLSKYHVQVACDANFYYANPGAGDPTSAGIPCEVYSLQISTGIVVSAESSSDAGSPRYASLLFSTNNHPFFAFDNQPPGTNTAGIYTAITGCYPLVSNGVNIGAAAINSFPNINDIHGLQPRTAFGTSQDNRYLYLMTIDGRQASPTGPAPPAPQYSAGAYDSDTAYWLMQFGAWNGIQMDGGGSTALYMADSTGSPLRLNHSSYLAATGHERYIGSHFGVYAKPLQDFISNIQAVPGDTSATITWNTASPATTQVQYGPTVNLGSYTTLSSDLVTNHTVVLSGLSLATGYYFQAMSSDGTTDYVSSNQFFTTLGLHHVFNFDNSWTYTVTDLDGINWTDPAYDDSGWDGSGPGLLWVDINLPNGNGQIPEPLLTQMPSDPSTGYPYRTYYLRTHFTLTNTANVNSLLFTDYLDDGAVFYLNGVGLYRLRMPAAPAQIFNATLASGYACSNAVSYGNAVCPDYFTISGDLLTNLVSGTNLLAAEVHNYSAGSPDITFGLAFDYIQPTMTSPTSPQLNFSFSNGLLTLTWTGTGFTLQQAASPAGPWGDVPGPVTTSPFTNTMSTANQFYRLRN